ncbi:uncharacterized protein LOC143232650 isoform X2 [Tachypleus tridentatus]|uniref:uncharacterized protein LOC143232650 isoform X2 n=1 Tax=Tachypleus tridentatus TaxID=6853 RepID=UPI003FD577B2
MMDVCAFTTTRQCMKSFFRVVRSHSEIHMCLKSRRGMFVPRSYPENMYSEASDQPVPCGPRVYERIRLLWIYVFL